MAFQDTSKANYAFKALLGKAHTSTEREIANEVILSGVTVSAARVWAEAVPTSSASATAAGIAVQLTDLELEAVTGADIGGTQVSYRVKLPGAVPSALVGKINPITNAVYQSGDYIGNIIPESFGAEGASDYRPVLYGNGVEIPPLDSTDWFLDPFSGVLTRENDGDSSGTWSTPLTIDLYVYTGQFVTDALEAASASISAQTLISLTDTPNTYTTGGYTLLSDGSSGFVYYDLVGTVSGITADIANLESDVAYISGAHDALDLQVTNLEGDVVYLSGAIDTNITNIAANDADISYLSGAIDTNITNIASNDADIAYISGQVDAGDTRITNLESDVLYISAGVDTNTTNIASNDADISYLSGAIDVNTALIASTSAAVLTEGDVRYVNVDGDTMTGDLTINAALNVTGAVDFDSTLNVAANATFQNDVTVQGNMYVNGSTVTVSAGEVTTSDNIILVNQGEVGPGVTSGYGGIRVDRGSVDDYFFVFDEDRDGFVVGAVTDETSASLSQTQMVATREDNPIAEAIPFWNNTQNRFDTDVDFTFDGTNVTLTNGDFVYSPANAGQWSFAGTAPSGVFEALDDIAAEIVTLNSGTSTDIAALSAAIDSNTTLIGSVSGDLYTLIADTSAAHDEFIELTDTPASYGTAGQVVVINGTSDGLEFVDADTVGRTELAGSGNSLDDTPATDPTGDEILTYSAGASAWVYYDRNLLATDAELAAASGALDTRVTNLEGDVVYISGQVDTLVSGIEADITYISGAVDVNTSAINANDADISYLSGAVDANTALIAAVSATHDEFIELTDTPAAYGTAGQVVVINGTSDGLEFVDADQVGKTRLSGDVNTSLTDTPSAAETDGDILVYSASSSAWVYYASSLLATDVELAAASGALEVDIQNLDLSLTNLIVDTSAAITSEYTALVNSTSAVFSTFDSLTDTPANTVGASGYYVRVAADGSGLEYVDLESTIASLTGDLEGRVTNLEGDVIYLSGAIDTNTSSIAANDADIAYISGQVAANDAEIANLESDVLYISGAVDVNTANIASNDADISYISGQVDAVDTRVTNLESDVIFISGAVDTNTTNIAANDADISYISGQVALNDADIAYISGALADNYFTKSESDTRFVNITGDTMTGDLTINAGLTVQNAATFSDNVTVNGSLFVSGATVSVTSEQVSTSDNVIVLNAGETNDQVTSGWSGIMVDRGTATGNGVTGDFFFVYDESRGGFGIGASPSTSAQIPTLPGDIQLVATRQDNPLANGVAVWNDTEQRFDTHGGMTFNPTTGVLDVTGELAYDVTIPGDWSFAAGSPTGVFEALDDLAAQVTVLGGAAVGEFDGLSDTPSTKAGSDTYTVEVSGTQLVYVDLRGELTTVIASTSGALDARVTNLEGDVLFISGAVDTNTTNIASNDADIAYISGQVDAVDARVTNLEGDVLFISAGVDTNTTNIASNDADISYISGQVDAVDARVTNLEGDVLFISAGVDTNTTNIANNTTLIGTVSGDLYTLVANVSATHDEFIELGDTPSTYAGASEYVVRVNTAGDGLEFVAADSVGKTRLAGDPTTSLTDTPSAAASDEDILTYSSAASAWVYYDKSLLATNVALADASGALEIDIINLDNSLTALLVDVSGNLQSQIEGSNEFIELTDTPSTFVTGSYLKATSAALEWVDLDAQLASLTGELNTAISSNDADISYISGQVAANDADIANLEGDVTALSAAIDGNTSAIALNDADIAYISGALGGYFTKSESDTRFVNITGDTMTGDLDIDAGLNVQNDATFQSAVTIQGDLYVSGTTVSVSSQQVSTEDNVIVLNAGEPGNQVTSGWSGIMVDRGTATGNGITGDFFFVFDENRGGFGIGASPSTSAQIPTLPGDIQLVATRQDNPLANGVAVWNDAEQRFDTHGGFTFNPTTGVLDVTGELAYDVTIPGDWSFAGTPTGVFEALDDLAAQVTTLGGAAVSDFDGLSDTPSTKTGSDTYTVEVSGTQLVYVDLRGEITTLVAATSAQTEVDYTSLTNTTSAALVALIAATSASANEFIEMTDSPATYAGASGQFVMVNSTENGVEFVDSATIDLINGLTFAATEGQDEVVFYDVTAGGNRKVRIDDLLDNIDLNNLGNFTFNVGSVITANGSGHNFGSSTFNGDVVVTGDLTVQGTTTTIDTEQLLVEDNIITLNSNVAGAPTTDAGIEINRGSSAYAQIIWDESADAWTIGVSGNTNFTVDSSNNVTNVNDMTMDGNLVVNGNVTIPNLSAADPNELLAIDGNGQLVGTGVVKTSTTGLSGSNQVIDTFTGADHDGAVWDFVVKNGTNLRAGQMYGVWDGTSVQYIETTTNDLGDTTDITLSVAYNGTEIEFRSTSVTDSWDVKFVRTAL